MKCESCEEQEAAITVTITADSEVRDSVSLCLDCAVPLNKVPGLVWSTKQEARKKG